MQWKNTRASYGLVAILLHWVVALAVIGLAILGLWMVDLSYYSPYYRSAPFWHKSIGLTLFAVLVVRLVWRCINPRPAHMPSHQRWEVVGATVAHSLLYLLLFVIVISGYLISTAKGQGVSFFGWFEVPALLSGMDGQADRAGQVHFWVVMVLLGLVALHALGALKHHFIDRDDTLRRMLSPRARQLTEKQE